MNTEERMLFLESRIAKGAKNADAEVNLCHAAVCDAEQRVLEAQSVVTATAGVFEALQDQGALPDTELEGRLDTLERLINELLKRPT